jgi:eukaryotic-like serine/threonine-protein kinase
MQLWTDYEGVTIDGAYPLQKLLLPEGRSAFFSTAGPNGEPTVVRLIECHFDEEDILARWRCVEALKHPNFLNFEHYGQVTLDDGPIVYAVFEKVDGNLAEVLDQGHLTVKDVAQLASSLVAALDELHTHGFIHEHVEPRNIFAVSDVVKLRSDCIREAPEGEEGRAAKQRDVRDMATVLLQALTQRQSLDGVPDSALPAPFGQIIRNGMDSAWGLEKIRTALDSKFGAMPQIAPKSADATPAAPAALSGNARKAPDAAGERSIQQSVPQSIPQPLPQEAQLPLPLVDEERKEHRQAEFAGATWRNDAPRDGRSFSLSTLQLGGVCLAAVLLLLCLWGIAHAWNVHRHSAAQASVILSQHTAQTAQQISANSAPAAAVSPRARTLAPGSSHGQWRVIAFTYNRKEDAEKKAASLQRSHPDLQPSVFAPSGYAPYLVSMGGFMDRDAAYALASRSRALGLPQDTYAQNYRH